MRWPAVVLVVLAILASGALSVAEAAQVARIPRMPFWTWLRKTCPRAASLAALFLGLERLLGAMATIAWSDLDVFLMRAARPTGDVSWFGAWVAVTLGLLGCGIWLPSVAAATIGWLLAFAACTQTVVVVRVLPLPVGRAATFAGIAAVTAVPALAVALVGERRARRDADPGYTMRMLRPLLGSLAAVLALTPALTSDRFVAGPFPKWVALLPPVGVSVYWVGILRPSALRDLPNSVRAFGAALIRRRREAWLVLTALLCLWHLAVLVTITTSVAAEGRSVLDQVARWPQLLLGQPTPGPEAWAPLAERLRELATRYRGHPWCGQWLIVASWIEAVHLNRYFGARVLLLDAKRCYAHARATPPPFWHPGRTVREIVDGMLARWGPLIDVGPKPV